jgi:hypothetical protein
MVKKQLAADVFLRGELMIKCGYFDILNLVLFCFGPTLHLPIET